MCEFFSPIKFGITDFPKKFFLGSETDLTDVHKVQYIRRYIDYCRAAKFR